VANLVAAVNDATQTVTNGVGAQYSVSTAKNANVTAAVDGTATTADFVANIAGTAGNFITGSTTNGTGVAFTNLDFGGAGSTHGTDAGAAQSAAAGDTITTGGQTYTFVNALSTVPVQNLANAINGGTGSGTTYSSNTQANTNVTATTGSNATGLETLTITATTKGLTGNTIATQTTGTANTFGGSLLSGGAAGSTNDLLTQADAQAALTLINNSVSAVAALRGNIGSTVNRLQSASNVINNQTQNLTSAENDVTAADIPSTVANLSQYSILEQTGISALAQANQQQQLVLKLLQ
jgi:flagellin